MRKILMLAALLGAGPGGAQAPGAEEFARSFRLAPGSYEAATGSNLLGVPLPRPGVRLRGPEQLAAGDIKNAFYTLPAKYGWRCASEQEVLLFPGTGDAGAAVARFLKTPRVQPLEVFQNNGGAAFTVGTGAFGTLLTYRGSLLLTACRAARNLDGVAQVRADLAAFVGASPYLLTLDLSGELRWCPLPGVGARRVQAFGNAGRHLDVSADGALVAVAGYDGPPVVKLYRAQSGSLSATVPLGGDPVVLKLAGDGRSVFVFDTSRVFTQYDAQTGRALASWKASSTVSPRLISGGASLVASFDNRSPLRVYDARTPRDYPLFSTVSSNLADASFTPDGRWLVLADRNGVFKTFDTRTWKPGPSANLGLRLGAALRPGRAGGEVLAFTLERPEGGAERVQVWSWTVGQEEVRRANATPRPRGDNIVVRLEDARPYSLAPCAAE